MLWTFLPARVLMPALAIPADEEGGLERTQVAEVENGPEVDVERSAR